MACSRPMLPASESAPTRWWSPTTTTEMCSPAGSRGCFEAYGHDAAHILDGGLCAPGSRPDSRSNPASAARDPPRPPLRASVGRRADRPRRCARRAGRRRARSSTRARPPSTPAPNTRPPGRPHPRSDHVPYTDLLARRRPVPRAGASSPPASPRPASTPTAPVVAYCNGGVSATVVAHAVRARRRAAAADLRRLLERVGQPRRHPRRHGRVAPDTCPVACPRARLSGYDRHCAGRGTAA